MPLILFPIFRFLASLEKNKEYLPILQAQAFGIEWQLHFKMVCTLLFIIAPILLFTQAWHLPRPNNHLDS